MRLNLDLNLKAVVRRHGRSLALLSASTVLAATHGPLWAYQRGLIGPHDPGLRVLLSGPLRLVGLVRRLALYATVGAAQLLVLDVRERWLDLLGRILAGGFEDARWPATRQERRA
jgi:hypothetical protein